MPNVAILFSTILTGLRAATGQPGARYQPHLSMEESSISAAGISGIDAKLDVILAKLA